MTKRDLINALYDFLDEHGWDGKVVRQEPRREDMLIKCDDGNLVIGYTEEHQDRRQESKVMAKFGAPHAPMSAKTEIRTQLDERIAKLEERVKKLEELSKPEERQDGK